MARETISTVIDSELLKELKRRRGLSSMSRLVEHYIKAGIDAEMSAFVPPPLRDARVTHSATRGPKTKIWHLDSSLVFPREDSPGGPAPYSVFHDLELKGRASEVKQGRHWLSSKCGFCAIVLRDFSG